MEDIHQVGLPVRAALGPNGLLVALRDIGPEQLHDPFLQETIKRVPARQVAVEIPKAELRDAPESAPAGVIFHVARCGSTLVSQLLKQHEQVVVYAEPAPFNELLVPPHKWERAELVAAVRELGAFFSRHARKPYVLKLTSWNTLFCDIVADAFPSTPWVLCIRDPVEVCVSLLQHRPGWLRDPRLFADVVDPTQSSRSPEEHVARLYAAFCREVGRLDSARGKLVAYEALPEAVWDVVGPHFGLSIGDQLKARMSAASTTYSKSPVGKATKFAPDDATKRAAASPELRRAIDILVVPELERLNARFRDASAPAKVS